MIENGIERESCLVHLAQDIEWLMPDNVFIKGMIIPNANTIVAQHSHEYDHTSLLVSGKVRVWKDDILLGDFEAPNAIFIEAKCKHNFLSLVDNTNVYCIHSTIKNGTVNIFEKNLFKEIA